jgi:hypothetical protein
VGEHEGAPGGEPGEDVVADFLADWVEILTSRLEELGYAVPEGTKPEKVSILFFSVMKRRVPARPRTVHVAPEVKCPEAHRAGLDALLAKVRCGDDLSPHQSGSLDDLAYNDAMLNDWGIFHFHLGLNVGKDGYVERTGPLAFARVTDSEFFLIDVAKHGAWSHQRLVEILHANWPHTIRAHAASGVSAAAVITDEQVAAYRRAGLLLPTQMRDGTVYLLLGGGYMSDGTSGEAVTQSDLAMTRVVQCENAVRKNAMDLVAKAEGQGFVVARPPTFKLVLKDDGQAAAHLVGTNLAFSIGNAWF